jgi:hypothetical protein
MVTAKQAAHQHEREESRQREGQDEGNVVRRERAAPEPLERSRDQCEAGEVFGQRQCAWHRREEWRAPPRRGERHDVRVPPQKPDAEDGVAGIVRDA